MYGSIYTTGRGWRDWPKGPNTKSTGIDMFRKVPPTPRMNRLNPIAIGPRLDGFPVRLVRGCTTGPVMVIPALRPEDV